MLLYTVGTIYSIGMLGFVLFVIGWFFSTDYYFYIQEKLDEIALLFLNAMHFFFLSAGVVTYFKSLDDLFSVMFFYSGFLALIAIWFGFWNVIFYLADLHDYFKKKRGR